MIVDILISSYIIVAALHMLWDFTVDSDIRVKTALLWPRTLFHWFTQQLENTNKFVWK